MVSKEIVVQNQVGLHARPATFFIQKANEFTSSIWISREERKVNAKSLLGVLSLGVTRGTAITLTAEGAHLLRPPVLIFRYRNIGFRHSRAYAHRALMHQNKGRGSV